MVATLSAERVIPRLRGLTFKQAAITLLVVLVLGVAMGVLQLFLDWRGMREEVREGMERTLALVEGSASEALYQLHPELGRQLVQGLFVFDAVQRVELRDDFGQVLAEQTRAPGAATLKTGWGWLFEDVIHFRLPLRYAASGATAADVGVLEVALSPDVLARRFRQQAMRDALFGIARAVFISLLVVVIFYFMITRPLLRLSSAIAGADPTRPGAWVPPRLAGHERDEMGLLLAHLDRLLRASQAGLDARDHAQRELTALTQDLEQRVQARTLDLERALEQLEGQKAEVERAFAELGRTHRRLSEANGLLLESHRYARRIQTAMLPDARALGDAVREIHVLWEPLHLVGGDWYWLERRGEQCLILVADCTGHGVPGAFITLVLASAAEQVLRESRVWDPAAILLALDEQVRRRLRQDQVPEGVGLESDDGLDAAILLWDAGSSRLTFASVGGMPLVEVAADGAARTIRGSRGHLGYQTLPSPPRVVNHPIQVRPGAVYFLMTDGIVDQMGRERRRLLGRRPVVEWLQANAGRGLEDQIEGLRGMLEDYRGGEPRRDDMTLVGVRLM
ncbi:SpoIIE family protein phosphatase [Thiocystis violacea]|uniref:SpoIIE family protein phosphatase n=1 Tax=Thiocystis violacea TaxID=13725 RepID=UPI001905B5F7|nr:SpoIIE family protein phosphatase [Thiocystis violacea]MBK1724129.1 serine/threonine protein phosphatase [Thiocystis violacea]